MHTRTHSIFRRVGQAALLGFSGLLALGFGSICLADQYHSEQKYAPAATPSQQTPQQMLKSTQDPYARAMLMRSLAGEAAQKKDYGAAAAWLQKALDQNALSAPAQAEMQAQITDLLSASGDPESVIKALQPLYRKNPNLAAAQLAALGAAYAAVKRYSEALPLLQRGIAGVKEPPAGWLKALVAAQIGSHNDAAAIPVLERLLNLAPGDRDAWQRLAQLQIHAGQREAALVTLQLMQRLGFLTTDALRLRLIALTDRLGAPFQAGSLLQHWLSDGHLPKSADHYQTLAVLWTRARERELAVNAYQLAAALHPAADSYRQIGQLQLALKQNAQAVKSLETALRLGGNAAASNLSLGMALFRAGNSPRAMQAFGSAAKAGGKYGQLAEQWLAWLQAYNARRPEQSGSGGQVSAPAQLADNFSAPPVQLGTQGDGYTASPGTAEATAAGSRLTPIGALRAGSFDGNIPPWTGGLSRANWPRGWQPGQHLKDPFPDDKPLYTVTAANAAQYAQYLIPSYKALLHKYPDYELPVYASRRSVAYPQAIYQATQANLGRAKLLGADALVGAKLGFPFPEPKSGVEVMWNHRVRYRGGSFKLHSTQAVVNPGSKPSYQHETELFYALYANIKHPVDIDQDNILFKYLALFGNSPNYDFLALVHEKANAQKSKRSIWVMPPGISRLFRIPPVGYDQPFPGSGGIYFLDMVDMYNGPFDRYVWKLTGKREILVPYNDYRVSDGRYSYDQLLGPQHFNQAAVRYELHRVWVIEATLREGEHHSFGKRVFYVDEDSWNVVLVENYDHEDHIWRFQEGHMLPRYGVQATSCEPVVTYDFKTGAYYVNHLIGHDQPAEFHLTNFSNKDFLPATVGIRYSH